MTKKDSKKLAEWLEALSEEKLRYITFDLIQRMVEIEELDYKPNEEHFPEGPYWAGGGQEIGEDFDD